MIYAIGDIHGRIDLLDQAVAQIDEHSAGQSSKMIFLGDYIDRGPDSCAVVKRLRSLEAERGAICLKGNHEQMAVQAHLFDVWDHWLAQGGEDTLASFGGRLGTAELGWLDGLAISTARGHRIFVHAGVDPDRVTKPTTEDALWIRKRFLDAPSTAFGSWHIVHGHTPIWPGKMNPHKPELLAHRTNLDTGAYYTGVLTVGVFDEMTEGGPREVLSIQQDRSAVVRKLARERTQQGG